MQLSMLDGLRLQILRRALSPSADHAAHSRPVVNMQPRAQQDGLSLFAYSSLLRGALRNVYVGTGSAMGPVAR